MVMVEEIGRFWSVFGLVNVFCGDGGSEIYLWVCLGLLRLLVLLVLVVVCLFGLGLVWVLVLGFGEGGLTFICGSD